ncbi:MAG: hypothetical protein O6909_04980 [Alphaproteobacteria bacterium]|nr:hypothetical protein [Alphaproteobacteria bacterium]
MADAATAVTPARDPSTIVQWRNLIWVAAAFGVMVWAILSRDLWFLNFVHVVAGLLWTGIDLFMGFVIGPILRRLDFTTRRPIISRLMPNMIFIMTPLGIIAPTAGWFLAVELGYLDLAFPQMWWFIAALVVTTILGVQGIGILLPTNIRVYLEMQKAAPDGDKIARLMRRYVRVVAFQGAMQVLIIVIMTRFATGI